jgi:hypothetical protein
VTRERLLGRALDLAADRVDDAEALIGALERLRRTLDRYDYFCPRWTTGREFNTSTLKLKLVDEFGAVRSAALKLGGRDVRKHARTVDALRGSALAVVEPANRAGLPLEESQSLRVAVEGLQDAAERATGRKPLFEWFLVSAFIGGVDRWLSAGSDRAGALVAAS